MEPTKMLFSFVHVLIKRVEEFVLEQVVVDQRPLAPSIVVRVVVSHARKVQPLGVTKLISCNKIVSKSRIFNQRS
jgi:hypothetical protein